MARNDTFIYRFTNERNIFMDIKIIGSGCENCGRLYDNTLSALAELTGRLVREDVTARIFERFCVGK